MLSSETSVLARATQRHIPEDCPLHSHPHRERLKSYKGHHRYEQSSPFLAIVFLIGFSEVAPVLIPSHSAKKYFRKSFSLASNAQVEFRRLFLCPPVTDLSTSNPQTARSHLISSCQLQGYGGGILTCLHSRKGRKKGKAFVARWSKEIMSSYTCLGNLEQLIRM
jgi:hypothetical protein